ncbi:hypothetical protein CC80DRAFT_554115 [Byssothecium circinans]|uniref:Uncharacterized protein n=1 Tax=Byssothecium circinans TaxID=147558 RepID=A0A6A5TG68_9PLEO|nr:hypothetical protein CC80DRAFT_554115 [Byssothecium circinans]
MTAWYKEREKENKRLKTELRVAKNSEAEMKNLADWALEEKKKAEDLLGKNNIPIPGYLQTASSSSTALPTHITALAPSVSVHWPSPRASVQHKPRPQSAEMQVPTLIRDRRAGKGKNRKVAPLDNGMGLFQDKDVENLRT